MFKPFVVSLSSPIVASFGIKSKRYAAVTESIPVAFLETAREMHQSKIFYRIKERFTASIQTYLCRMYITIAIILMPRVAVDVCKHGKSINVYSNCPMQIHDL